MSDGRVVIIGAGIGGMTAALALHAAGIEVHVFEQAPRLEGLGAGIQLAPNATRILRALKVLDAVDAVSFRPQAVQFRNWKSGTLIAAVPLGSTSESRHGAPYLHVHRGDLQTVLLDAVTARGIPMTFGRRCTGIDPCDDHVDVLFGDAALQRCDVLIGCDGIHSQIRTALFGAQAPRFTGYVAWRGLVPAARLPAGLIAPAATAWLGPRRHLVNYFVRRGELVNFVGVIETDGWQHESWTAAGDPDELRRDFAAWHPHVQELIAHADDCFKWALFDREPLPNWSVGRVTLLGDACHPMLPFLAQGGAAAIEDAWVLARRLEGADDEPAALVEYQRHRQPRTGRLQYEARRQGDMFHVQAPWDRFKRNLRLGVGSRLLPELALQQLDWIHGYDAVRDFR
jgi:salicylate hydroxylase